ncbi:Beta-phosphoglucomutase [Apilactobacillus kunkeei]|uniref:beta-phosphoglucomutase n=1 Tax=Apilactobacillus kunkeei TaxID=148814 RepID=UPI00110CE034|nr:beta-phosphoglucomutase [Apilactobacillus kunkeei]TMT02650.1 beta-phosphoglucomutase [Apilactobacillus kunkeei]CAI2550699.1 Beta-phosphoglucomutase [Apilactobacillus kunkeei]CAI2607434.1 Beta-phosphoglucomutase [Apilactobacillus kunkeei]CAI2608438.1 Beta-phosphoglucomutase [Apilactobacillus kunkeei]
MGLEKIKGFIFDLDGVISNTSVLHSKAWKQIAEKVGTPWDDKLAADLKGVDRMDSLNLILDRGNLQGKYSEEDKLALAQEKNDNYLNLVDQMSPNDILPGVKDFLDSLKDNRYLISLASASKNAPTVLEKLKLSDYFEKVVNPAELSKGKPDPEIYVKGAEILGLTPEECIGIEDAEVGIAAINGAGEISVGIGDAEILKDANIVFSNTKYLTLDHIEKAL